MLSDPDRIKKFISYTKKSKNAIGISIGDKNGMRLTHVENGRNNISEKLASDIVNVYSEISYDWLVNGTGEMISSTKDVEVSKFEQVEDIEDFKNSNGNNFIKLPNGQYYMTMPLADFKIQAGFLDHYQDADFLMDMEQHGMIVDRYAKGRYVAFKVSGDSMDDGSLSSIPKDSVVSTRELQRHHWKYKLKYKEFPFWVIYTTESRLPLVKQITNHDIENGIITCHSLNTSPEYADFNLNIDDVQALFYVINVTRNVSNKFSY